MSDLHAMAGSYVAGALDDHEREDFERHLGSCAACRDEVIGIREALAEAATAHEVPAPPMLRSSILAAIASTPQLPADEPPTSADVAAPQADAAESPTSADEPPAAARATGNVVAPEGGFGRPRRPVATWLAAAAAALAVALGGVTVWQQSELEAARTADAQRVELLSAPDVEVASTPLADGQLTYIVSEERGQALLVSADLPDPGEGRSWQVWVVDEGAPRSGAVLDAGGPVQAWIQGLPGGDVLAVTNEPRGGSPAPTTEDVQAVHEL